jgi:GH15 family glucan-1,4-alpha-glucosidase
MIDLYQHSIETILKNQYTSGGFPASPDFPPYQYSWFRDGSFIAYALDMAGYPDRAEMFHRWCANAVMKHSHKILSSLNDSDPPDSRSGDWHFHCRFTEDGGEVPGHWGNHQLDGLGTWLWALDRHIDMCPRSRMENDHSQSTDLIADYLAAFWRYPCSDCWEENEAEIHTSTLAAVYAGLLAHSKMRGSEKSLQAAREVKQFVEETTGTKGYLTKSLNNPDIDASLLWAGWPYALVDPGSPVFHSTLMRIEKKLLSPEGGVRRYPADTYYGGGEWLLLAAWLGWVRLRMGDQNIAERQLRWIESQADPAGNLPEQVNHHIIDLKSYEEWVEKWGQSARPLLWSHAMYIILKGEIDTLSHVETAF